MDCCCPKSGGYDKIDERPKVVIRETAAEKKAREKMEDLATRMEEGKTKAKKNSKRTQIIGTRQARHVADHPPAHHTCCPTAAAASAAAQSGPCRPTAAAPA